MNAQLSAPPPPLTLLNANLNGEISSLRIADRRIAGTGEAPARGERVIDVGGDRVLPGLINAHDHLQLNSLPPLPDAPAYRHARHWISDVERHRRVDSVFEAAATASREARLLIGGIKNLLSGVTTVAHHDPFYPPLAAADFPVQVVSRYGWSHSLYLEDADTVRASCQGTPAPWPWIIHLAEGVGEEAREELPRLEALGCLTPRTLIVHGLALDPAQRRRLSAAGAGLIWCPSSNLRLFAKAAQVDDLVAQGRVALGSDSRLTGARDLLAELWVARELGQLPEATLERLVSTDAARLLQLTDRGSLTPGARADLLVLPAGKALSWATRADVRLVMIGGAPAYGDQAYMHGTGATPVRVDGHAKQLDRRLAARLALSGLREEGLELSPRI